jgi:SAM-dependent methyltransferase
MAWLVIAKWMIAFHGSDPILAAGVGEWLPLRDGQLSGVVSLDVIEHVRDSDRYLCEIDRVVGVGGSVALRTPNRFSLTSEPHVLSGA